MPPQLSRPFLFPKVSLPLNPKSIGNLWFLIVRSTAGSLASRRAAPGVQGHLIKWGGYWLSPCGLCLGLCMPKWVAAKGAGQQYRINVLHTSLGPAGWGRGLQVDGFAGFGAGIQTDNKMWLHFLSWKGFCCHWLVRECGMCVFLEFFPFI